MIRIGLDTNVLAYLAGVDRSPADAGKIDRSRGLVRQLSARATLVAPTQALGELFVVLSRSGHTREAARDIVVRMRSAFAHADSSSATLLSALDAAAAHRLQLWDAIVLTAAAEAGCAMLLSEDMSPGFTWRGATIVNPFAPSTDERWKSLGV